MLTWLDYYIQGAAENLGNATGEPDSFDGDDVASMAILSALNLERLTKYANKRRIDSDEAVAAMLSSCIHAFTAQAIPDDLHRVLQHDQEGLARKLYTLQALRPSADLLDTLRHAKAPATNDWKEPLLSATWYFDIPDKALRLGPSLQLRAMFTQPSLRDTVATVCILTAPGSNKIAGRFAWIWGQSTLVYGLRIPGVNPQTVRDHLEHLLRLLVLYAQVAEKAEFAPLPRITAQELSGLKPKKRKARLKKASLFTVRELKPPKDRFGRQLSKSSKSGWRLDQAVEVRGHFRWQPHGPKHSKRKMIWIEPYVRGPKDHAPKPILKMLSDG